MQSYGVGGRGGSNHQPDPGLLRGLLAPDAEVAVYPEDRCEQCEAEGLTDEHCFHHHWADAE